LHSPSIIFQVVEQIWEDMANCCVFVREADDLEGATGTEAAISILHLRRRIETFGKVRQVSELEGGLGGMMVAYEDPQAAAKAREAFGSCKLQSVEDGNWLKDDAFYSCAEDLKLLQAPTSATISLPLVAAEDSSSVDSLSETSQESTASDSGSWAPLQGASSKPYVLKGLELNQICWDRFASQKEWRTCLQLRGLPKRLCEKRALQAFLLQHYLMSDVQKVEVRAKIGPRIGSAVLYASSVDGAERLARFFHGRVVSTGSMPVSVSFANDQACRTSSKKPLKLTEPQRIDIDGLDSNVNLSTNGADPWLEPRLPPGLEDYARPATLGCLPPWNSNWSR